MDPVHESLARCFVCLHRMSGAAATETSCHLLLRRIALYVGANSQSLNFTRLCFKCSNILSDFCRRHSVTEEGNSDFYGQLNQFILELVDVMKWADAWADSSRRPYVADVTEERRRKDFLEQCMKTMPSNASAPGGSLTASIPEPRPPQNITSSVILSSANASTPINVTEELRQGEELQLAPLNLSGSYFGD